MTRAKAWRSRPIHPWIPFPVRIPSRLNTDSGTGTWQDTQTSSCLPVHSTPSHLSLVSKDSLDGTAPRHGRRTCVGNRRSQLLSTGLQSQSVTYTAGPIFALPVTEQTDHRMSVGDAPRLHTRKEAHSDVALTPSAALAASKHPHSDPLSHRQTNPPTNYRAWPQDGTGQADSICFICMWQGKMTVPRPWLRGLVSGAEVLLLPACGT
jgi:hypothetical protein